jgi:hypothetical protein
VSDLIATNAPNKSLLDPLFALYNLLVIAFALSLFQKVHGDDHDRGKVVGKLVHSFYWPREYSGL